MRQFEPKFNPGVDDLSYEEVDKIQQFIVLDHPELFWFKKLMCCDIFGKIDTRFNINIIYRYSKEEAVNTNNRIKPKYESIINEANKCKTDKDKIDLVRERLMGIGNYSVDKEDNVSDYYNLVSIFDTGNSMCGGFSYGFKFIMDRVGVTSIAVTDIRQKSSDSHIWNMVKIDGDWYNLDISFDDSLRDKYHVKEKYYLVDNDTFYKDHQINEYLPNLKEKK